MRGDNQIFMRSGITDKPTVAKVVLQLQRQQLTKIRSAGSPPVFPSHFSCQTPIVPGKNKDVRS